MSTITSNPFFMRESILTLGTDDFAAALSSAAITPSSSLVSFKGLKPGSQHSFSTTPTWALDITYAQDFESDASLSLYLFQHAGETIAGVLEPVAGGASWAINVIITPGAIGGAIDTVPVATVSLGVSGTPVLTPA